MLGGIEWHWWNYALVTAGSLGFLYSTYLSTYPLFQKIWSRAIKSILGKRPSQRKEKEKDFEEEHPDCTVGDLKKNYLEAQLLTDSPGFEIGVEAILDFQLLNKFLSRKLFEGKIKAWGKETRDGRVSPKEILIPREYWEFSRIDFWEETIDEHSMEEVIYTNLRFNQKQIIKQMESFFSKYDEEMQNAQDTNS